MLRPCCCRCCGCVVLIAIVCSFTVRVFVDNRLPIWYSSPGPARTPTLALRSGRPSSLRSYIPSLRWLNVMPDVMYRLPASATHCASVPSITPVGISVSLHCADSKTGPIWPIVPAEVSALLEPSNPTAVAPPLYSSCRVNCLLSDAMPAPAPVSQYELRVRSSLRSCSRWRSGRVVSLGRWQVDACISVVVVLVVVFR